MLCFENFVLSIQVTGVGVVEQQWAVGKPGANCCLCNAGFAPETRYFSALIQTPEKLERKDYCAECFQARRPENVYYFWKRTQPDPENLPGKRRPMMDVEYVLEFFKRLEGDDTPQRIAFRFLIALMLARKKTLIFEGRQKGPAGGEFHLYREKRGGQAHTVLEPALSEEEITSATAELGVLLGLSAPPAPSGAAPASPDAAPADGGEKQA